MIFAQGSRFGGHSLFIKDGILTYAYNFLDQVVAEGELRTLTGHFSLSGEGIVHRLRRRRRRHLDVHPRFELTGGRIVKVVFDVAYIDVECHLAAAMARD